MSYAFVERICPTCAGCGFLLSPASYLDNCPKCHGTGIVGTFEYVPDIEQPKPTEFGSKLRRTREQHKVTLRELAQELGRKDVAHLSDIETGRIVPTPEEIRMIEEWINGE